MRCRIRVGFWQAVCAAALAACTSGQSGSLPNVATPNIATSSTLQFSVGTATIGIANGNSTVGLNVVATFRQANGNNATGVNTPTLTGPAGLKFDPLLGGSNSVSGVTLATLSALVGAVVSGTIASAPPGTLASGFGPFVGVFGYGLAADNLISNADLNAIYPIGNGNRPCLGVGSFIGQAASGTGVVNGGYYGLAPNIGVVNSSNQPKIPGDLVRSAELALPIPSGSNVAFSGNCTCPSTCTNGTTLATAAFNDFAFPFQYFGGPPAWPSPQGYGNFSYFVGYPLGFTDFTATPVAGSYTLSVAYPTSATYSSFATIVKTATLPAGKVSAPLPAFPQPGLTVNADGSGVLSVNVPAGASEAVISIVSSDCDLAGRDLEGNVYFNHYAVVTHATGPQTLFLSSLLGPPGAVSGLPTHTFCTSTDLGAFNAVVPPGVAKLASLPFYAYVGAVGFDYPAYESSYPFNTGPAPTITSAAGTADITTSYPLTVTTTVLAPPGN